jgi:hypothetical protein
MSDPIHVDAVKELANSEVDHAIKMISAFANVFRNKTIDFERVGVEREADFYLGAAWVTATDFFTFDFVKRYERKPTQEENNIIMQTVYARLPEFKQAISDLGI